jgi:hypothetical protein
MNFCKNCKHYSKTWWFAEPECLHKESLYVVCRVEGKAKWRLCREMRWAVNACGDEADLFEAKVNK